ncbi:MAG: hypothetical protein IPJ52_05710 [Rhodocyclaceae bacterium]|nr:hypothetical protein [Rhodocyclaceae bacterium]
MLSVFNADKMLEISVGAMCAVGIAQRQGPRLSGVGRAMAVFFLAARLAINHDTRGARLPAARHRHASQLALLPAVALVLDCNWHTPDLKANVITSGCGQPVLGGHQGPSGDLAALPPVPAMAIFNRHGHRHRPRRDGTGPAERGHISSPSPAAPPSSSPSPASWPSSRSTSTSFRTITARFASSSQNTATRGYLLYVPLLVSHRRRHRCRRHPALSRRRQPARHRAECLGAVGDGRRDRLPSSAVASTMVARSNLI